MTSETRATAAITAGLGSADWYDPGLVLAVAALDGQAENRGRAAERAYILEHVVRLQKNASCKTVKKTCQAIIDRIREGT